MHIKLTSKGENKRVLKALNSLYGSQYCKMVVQNNVCAMNFADYSTGDLISDFF